MAYIRFPIETDPETLVQDVYNYIRTYAPDWTPADGNLDVWIIRALVYKAAETRDLASDVQDSIFRYFGSSLMAIAPQDSTHAHGSTTWTMIDTAGHTIPAGTSVALFDVDGTAYPFYTIADFTVPLGSAATAPGAVSIQALNPGSAASGLGGVVQLIDVLDFVQSVAIVGNTSGGVDAEADADYLNRLVRKLQRLSQRPILPQDFADAAFDASPEVARAVALDGYNPVGGTWNNDRMVTIAAVTSTGTAVSAGAKTAIDAYLQANREVNFIVNVMDPQFTQIDVHADIVVAPGYDPATIVASVVAAINSYLSPANWGVGRTDDTWIESNTVYYNELIALVGNVLGVDRVTDLTVNKHLLAPGRVNVPITSPAGLTQPITITATAV